MGRNKSLAIGFKRYSKAVKAKAVRNKVLKPSSKEIIGMIRLVVFRAMMLETSLLSNFFTS